PRAADDPEDALVDPARFHDGDRTRPRSDAGQGRTMPDMAFDVAATSYDRFMGGWSGPLSGLFADFAGTTPGLRALDVGCGPGSLTTQRVGRLGADQGARSHRSEPC